MQVRRVRGPLLDTLYARLMRCSKPRRLNQTCPDEAAAALGWLLSQANGDRFPTREATLGQALGKYLESPTSRCRPGDARGLRPPHHQAGAG